MSNFQIQEGPPLFRCPCLDLFFVLFKAKCLLWVIFCPVAVAFVFKLFSFFGESSQVEECCSPNLWVIFLVTFLGVKSFLPI